MSIRESTVGVFNGEMGLQAVDSDLARAAAGERVITPAGMVLDGAVDQIKPPLAPHATEDPDADGVANEIPASLVDFMEFYLLNYFKPGLAEPAANGGTTQIFPSRGGLDQQSASRGRAVFQSVGCGV